MKSLSWLGAGSLNFICIAFDRHEGAVGHTQGSSALLSNIWRLLWCAVFRATILVARRRVRSKRHGIQSSATKGKGNWSSLRRANPLTMHEKTSVFEHVFLLSSRKGRDRLAIHASDGRKHLLLSHFVTLHSLPFRSSFSNLHCVLPQGIYFCLCRLHC
jgi:hypothetical protein